MVIRSFSRRRACLSHRILSVVISLTFIFSFITPPNAVFAQGTSASALNLPAPGSMVSMSNSFTPLYIKGITVHPEDPLKFSFIIDPGDANLDGEAFKAESQKLINYFLAALTVPEEEMWVNLSPYERDNIIPQRFGYTEMGRDLLAQDYILKQITASIMYPEGTTGSTFWNTVQQKVKEKFGGADVPVNMFNKIWIIPDKAEVYEINGSAYLVDSHLKVMLEEDYFSLKNKMEHSKALGEHDVQAIGAASSQAVREVLLPEIEKEVNEGKNFANLRQIYNAGVLATWYKLRLKDSLLGQVYVDKNKVSGIDMADKSDKLKIYDQYVAAFKKGAYELIKRDYDPATQQVTSTKYFAGGATFDNYSKVVTRGMEIVPPGLSPEKALSSGQFEKLTEGMPPGKTFARVQFDLGMLQEPSPGMRELSAASSPMEGASSERSRSLTALYYSAPKKFVSKATAAMQVIFPSNNQAEIAKKVEIVERLVSDASPALSGDLKTHLTNEGFSLLDAGRLQAQWGRVTEAIVTPMDARVSGFAARTVTEPAQAWDGFETAIREISPAAAVPLRQATEQAVKADPKLMEDPQQLITVVLARPEVQALPQATRDQVRDQMSRPEVFIRAMEQASSPMDVRIAPIAAAAMGDDRQRQRVENNLGDYLEFSPETNITDARKVRSAVTELTRMMIERPEVALDTRTLGDAVRSNGKLAELGLNKVLASDKVLMPLITSGLSRLSLRISTAAGLFNAYPGPSVEAAAKAIAALPIARSMTPEQPRQAAQLMAEAAQSKKYLSLDSMKKIFRQAGLPMELAEQDTMEGVAGGIIREVGGKNKFDLETVNLAASMVGFSENSRKMISDSLGQLPDIDQEAPRIAQLLVDNPRALVSRNAILGMLKENKVSEKAARATVSNSGISALGGAVRMAFDRDALQENPGGIDINPALLDLLVKRDGNGIKIPMAQLPVKDTDIYGFEPVIFKIEQVDNLPAFIGIEEGSGTAATARNLQ